MADKPKTYSNTYVNFYVALTASTSLFAGIVNPKMAAWLIIPTCLATTWWGVSFLVQRHKDTH